MKQRSERTLGGKNLLHLKGIFAFDSVTRDINRASTSVDDNYVIPDLQGISLQHVDRNLRPDLHCISRNTVVDAEVKASFAFCNEMDPLVSLPSIRDKLGLDSRPSHGDLFGASPTVWVAEDENNVRFH